MHHAKRLGEQCQECGQVHWCCRGHNKTGNPCGKRPKAGRENCDRHGGNLPNVVAAGEAKIVNRKATAYLASLDLQPGDYTDPHQALLEELETACREVTFYGEQLKGLGVPVVDGTAGEFDNIEGVGEDGELIIAPEPQQLYGPKFEQNRRAEAHFDRSSVEHIVLTMWHAARDRKAKVAKVVIELGLAERQQRVTEDQAKNIVALLMRVGDHPDLALSREQLQAFRTIAAEELRRESPKALASAPAA